MLPLDSLLESLGPRDPDKCTLVHGAVGDDSPSVACLQETKLASLPLGKDCSFLPARLSVLERKDADGSRGGLVTTWDPSVLSLVSRNAGRYTLTTAFSSTSSDLAFTVTNVYAPSDHSFTQEFFDEMMAISNTISGAWLMLGDFNLIRCTEEKNNDNF